VTRFWLHLRRLWPGWTILAPLPFVAHAVWAAARGAFHVENAIVLVIVLALFSVGPRTKRLFLGAYPLGLVGLLYDSMRFVARTGMTPESVHVCDLRAHELALFGVTMNGERVTFHDWFVAHPSPFLDGLCAIPYATFILVCIACAVWMFFRDYGRMLRFTWCFLTLNVAGFVTYHLYPAAPPWYFHAHGCAVDLLAHASEGPALARVDARLGIHYFAGMYGRSASVFGAMPSLHCAYACMVALEGWAVFGRVARAASCAFLALMCFSAVYLDHHWVLDVLAGLTYAVVVVAVARALARGAARRSRQGVLAPVAPGEGP
jgi:membrane-associated phospholipid phosphatase